ncbi:alcohol dehydrogenase catalytic domain-containing protein [Streptomyces sp. XH2]|uniref:alcohol dehydrogenase catalytic domain-containing protein n=1 Tax=Streptomyces sp. XH2 TaxID=3412483 RepID=UPI003C7A5E7D
MNSAIAKGIALRRYELVGRREIRLSDDVPVPVPGPGEVLVRVAACTVCNRSDLVYYHYYGLREHCARGCFGHEISGTVAGTGPGVTRFATGRRVFVRTPLTTGYAEYALAREVCVGALPDHVPFEQGAILQLLPLAVHATRGVRLGDRVAIVGQGPVGLMALLAAAARGASHLTVRLVRRHGLVVLLGTHHIDTRAGVDLVTWERKGLRVHSSAEPHDVARAEAMAVAERLAADRTDRLHLDEPLTHVLPLAELPRAVRLLSASRSLHPDGERAPYAGPPPRVLKVAVRP